MPHKGKKRAAKAAAKKTAVVVVAPQKLQGKGKYTVSRAPLGGRLSGKGNYLFDWLGQGIKHGASWLGEKVGDWISGLGPYHVRHNVVLSNQAPQFTAGQEGTTVICHTEFVSDVVSTSTNFAVVLSQASVNPTNSQLFPWLAGIAANYEEYHFEGLCFYYKPTSGAAVSSTNPSLGVVIAAVQYNPYDTAFTSKVQMEAYQYAVSAVPFEPMLIPVECDPKLNPVSELFCNPASTGDLRFTEQGALSVAISGLPSNSQTCGELWVTYCVRLLKPKLPPPGLDETMSHFSYSGNGASLNTMPTVTPTSGQTSLAAWLTNGLGLTAAYTLTNGPGIILSGFNVPGYYGYFFWTQDSSAGNVSLTATTTNMTAVNNLSGSATLKSNSGESVANAGATQGSQMQFFSISSTQAASAPTATFKVSSNGSDNCNLDIFVVFFNQNLGARFPLDRRPLADKMQAFMDEARSWVPRTPVGDGNWPPPADCCAQAGPSSSEPDHPVGRWEFVEEKVEKGKSK